MTIFHFKMAKKLQRTALACGFAISTAFSAAANEIPVPSGQSLTFLEFLSENDGDVVRFRFLAPQIGLEFAYVDVMGDFQVVCDQQVMPVLLENGLTPIHIVLSMSAVDIPFGEPAPDVLQFFEVFRPENNTCIWEEY